jgi:hypothetical protein
VNASEGVTLYTPYNLPLVVNARQICRRVQVSRIGSGVVSVIGLRLLLPRRTHAANRNRRLSTDGVCPKLLTLPKYLLEEHCREP